MNIITQLLLIVLALEVRADRMFKLEDKDLASSSLLFVEESKTGNYLYAFATENLSKCSFETKLDSCKKVLDFPNVDRVSRCSDRFFLLTSLRKAWYLSLDNLRLTELNLPFFIFPSAVACRAKNHEIEIFAGFHNGFMGVHTIELHTGRTTTTYASLFANSIVDMGFDRFSNLVALSRTGDLAIVKDPSASRILALGETQAIVPKLKKLALKTGIRDPLKTTTSQSHICAIGSATVQCIVIEGLRPLQPIMTNEQITNGLIRNDSLALETKNKVTIYKNWQKDKDYEGELVSNHDISNSFFIKHNTTLIYVTP